MKIKRFHGKTMHEAIRRVREEQGPDAVILSNRRVAGGVEVVAAVDYDAALMQQTARVRDVTPDEVAEPRPMAPEPVTVSPQPEPTVSSRLGALDFFGIKRSKPASPPAQALPRAPAEAFSAEPISQSNLAPSTALTQQAGEPLSQSIAVRPPSNTRESAATPLLMTSSLEPASAAAFKNPLELAAAVKASVAIAAAANAQAEIEHAFEAVSSPAQVQVQTSELVLMRNELTSMRHLFEERLAGMAWNDLQRQRPGQAAAVRMLADLGIEAGIAKSIAEDLPDANDEARARYLPLGFLARRLKIDSSDPVMKGGVYALIGPTGAGKTTTIAKLAGRFVAQYGTRDIALVTTDHFRIGATEHLYNYGRLLGVPVHALGPREDLSVVLQGLADRRLVLVDTAGLGSRDHLLAAQIDRLSAAGPSLKAFLVLAANVDIASQKETVRVFSKLPIVGCVMTKVDEADRLGAALSVGLVNKLAFTYFTDGQRVPEDIHLAVADKLVLRATQLARKSAEPLDEHALARGLSSTVSHAHV